MKKMVYFLCLLFCNSIFGLEKLDTPYLVSYGEPNSNVKVISYFSFKCPHCVELFRKEFQKIRSLYLENNKISFTFHPVPMDLLTVQAMACLEQLADDKKKIFLEAILEELDFNDQEFSAILMEKAMELLGKPISLRDKQSLSKTPAFVAAFKFLKQEEKMDALPAVEVNGQLYSEDIPDTYFIKGVLNEN